LQSPPIFCSGTFEGSPGCKAWVDLFLAEGSATIVKLIDSKILLC